MVPNILKTRMTVTPDGPVGSRGTGGMGRAGRAGGSGGSGGPAGPVRAGRVKISKTLSKDAPRRELSNGASIASGNALHQKLWPKY